MIYHHLNLLTIIKSELINKVLHEQVLFEEMLGRKDAVSLVKQENPIFIQIIQTQINWVLIALFSNPKRERSINVSKIISFENYKIANAIASTPFFRELAFNILTSENVDSSFLTKICSVNSIILAKAQPEFFLSSISILSLLSFSDETGPYYFFQSLFSETEKYSRCYSWIIEIGFINFLYGEMKKTPKDSLFQIFCFLLSNPYFISAIQISDFYEIVTNNMESLQIGQWNSIYLLFDKIGFDENLVKTIIKVFENKIDRISHAHVFALKIFSQLIQVNSSIVTPQIIQSLFHLLLQFKSCSDFHLEFIQFICRALQIKSLRLFLIQILLPSILTELQTGEISLLQSTFFRILEEFDHYTKNNSEISTFVETIPEYYAFVNFVMKRRSKILENDYGNSPFSNILSKFHFTLFMLGHN